MAKLEYKMFRGDYRELSIFLPTDGWTSGSSLFFVVKSMLDNASTDNGTDTVIKVDMTDADIVDPAFNYNGVICKKYRCVIPSDMTQGYQMTSSKKKLIAEVQYVAPGNKPVTYPQFTFLLYRDANRRRA